MKKNRYTYSAALAGFLVVMLIVLYLLQKLLMPKYMSDIPEGGNGRRVL